MRDRGTGGIAAMRTGAGTRGGRDKGWDARRGRAMALPLRPWLCPYGNRGNRIDGIDPAHARPGGRRANRPRRVRYRAGMRAGLSTI
jgi:hypothetical protein